MACLDKNAPKPFAISVPSLVTDVETPFLRLFDMPQQINPATHSDDAKEQSATLPIQTHRG
jgi:hypothetical protein